MVGIVSYGIYIPRYRLDRKLTFQSIGWLNPSTAAYAKGEKAVANYDEDSVTMATEACMNCIRDRDQSHIEGLYFASTTMPYKERQNSVIIATALNLPEDIRTADFSSGLRSATTALLNSIDTVKAGSSKDILICSSDERLGKMGTTDEMLFGDAACALLIGSEDVIAEFKGSYSLSLDFVDHHRGSISRYERSWEERWIRDEGLNKIIPSTIRGLLNRFNLRIENFSKILISIPFPMPPKRMAKIIKTDPEVLEDTMITQIGYTGSPHPLLMLVKALEDSRPGDRLLLLSIGNGSDAIIFEVKDKIRDLRKDMDFKRFLKRKTSLSYEKYTVFKNLAQADLGLRAEEDIWTRWSFMWRNRKTILGLIGSRCKVCHTPQYPPQHVCVNPDCGAIDQMEEYPFSYRRGRIFNYTADMLAASIDPPAIHGQIDFEGGGRYWFDFTDCALDDLRVGMRVRMSFRKKYYDEKRDIYGYFWKAVPEKEG